MLGNDFSLMVVRFLKTVQSIVQACADNSRQSPDDLSEWLPWEMSEERLEVMWGMIRRNRKFNVECHLIQHTVQGSNNIDQS